MKNITWNKIMFCRIRRVWMWICKGCVYFIGSPASHDDVPDPIIAIKDLFMVFFVGWASLWGAVCVHQNQLSFSVFELFPSSFVQFHLPLASCLFPAGEFTVISWTCANLLLAKIKWRRSFIVAPNARRQRLFHLCEDTGIVLILWCLKMLSR